MNDGVDRKVISGIGDFARHTHNYICENIKMADQKAAFIFAISSALLVFLFRKEIHYKWLKPLNAWILSDFIAFLAMMFLAFGIIMAFLVVKPRLTKTHEGYIFFKSIKSKFSSANDYAAYVYTQNEIDLNNAILKHCYDLSLVCTNKYLSLLYSVWFSAIGVILSIVLFCLASL